MRKALAILLCTLLLVTALPGTALAADEQLSKEAVMIQQTRKSYTDSLATAQVESFTGKCGLMTSHQLWHMGINDWLEVYDGNKQFDAYAAKEQTSGGYYITAYSASNYTLEQALNTITRNGTRDAYNILVGFEWTNTEAGAQYGHACVVNAILDGTVYFVESFPTSLGGAEGNVLTCSIEQFANFFADWTTFDGVIHFGTTQAVGRYQFFGTDVFVRTRFESTLRSEPCLLTENNCTRVRSLAGGEMLRATAVCKNSRGELYYFVEDGEQAGYVIANAVSVVRVNGEDVTLTDAIIPNAITQGEDFSIDGAVVAANSSISTLEVAVTDQYGRTAMRGTVDINDYSCSLSCMNDLLAFDTLEEGVYQLSVYAKAACVVVKGAGLSTQHTQALLCQQEFCVGDSKAQAKGAVFSQEEEPFTDGWFFQNGTWYYYQHGKPCSGWIQYLGVDYYLQEDGSVTTGWADIDGWMRCFSSTGAMCTGWLTTQEGISYRFSDGVGATGWQEIEGKLYYFDENALLVTQGTVQNGDITYELRPDGVAVEVTEPTEPEE